MSRILRLIYVIFVVVQGCERLLVWVARFGFLIYPLYGIVSWFMTSRKERVRKRAALVEALFSVLAASAVSLLIRRIWHRPRPFTQGKTARITHGDNASFPSNHTLNAVAAAFSLILSRQSGGKRLLGWALLQGISRVFAGVHYTSDIIGSAVLAAGCAVRVHSSQRLRKLSRQLAYICTEAEDILRRK
mgnify:FL=1